MPPFVQVVGLHEWLQVPSDTKLLLWKNYSEIINFVKITNFTRNSLKMSLFAGDSRVQNASKITKNNSQRIIFVIISCQRVLPEGVLVKNSQDNNMLDEVTFVGTRSKFLRGQYGPNQSVSSLFGPEVGVAGEF